MLCFVEEAEGLATQVLRAYLGKEKVMESELYRSILNEGQIKGDARRMAETVVRILFRRLGYVEEAIPQRVRAETQQDVLETWYEEALNVIDETAARRLVENIQRIRPPVG